MPKPSLAALPSIENSLRPSSTSIPVISPGCNQVVGEEEEEEEAVAREAGGRGRHAHRGVVTPKGSAEQSLLRVTESPPFWGQS